MSEFRSPPNKIPHGSLLWWALSFAAHCANTQRTKPVCWPMEWGGIRGI